MQPRLHRRIRCRDHLERGGPEAPERSPAPPVHAHDDEKRDEYLQAYRVFLINFRAGVDGLLAKAKLITDLFPRDNLNPGITSTPVASARRRSSNRGLLLADS